MPTEGYSARWRMRGGETLEEEKENEEEENICTRV